MKIKAMYFSPTRTSEKVTMTIARKIAMKLKTSLESINITKNDDRNEVPKFSNNDVLILGLPVYAGRIPEIVEEYIHNLKGNMTKAIILAIYGNRDYDDALLEMRNILDENGFEVIAAGAFIGEHSFTEKVATGRPDEKDLEEARAFGDSIAVKLEDIGNNAIESIEVKGNYPYKERGELPQVAPSTNDNCTECMDCTETCPTNAISKTNPKETDTAKCILCCECIKICPENAKFNADENILKIAKMLEDNFSKRKDPELFI
ncbi:EFR1 family ferrodoxin [Methanobrevibacter sp. TMH8]|uniref:EFR1 family ferrodoxin n=1 Tax=Methanobrevibacter sp. TMH8 TaxID=2848611 RepID=UPI001CCAE024|nr:EFR1 family ferrodoxin [Methanobrevibacter sp. TMH8]MBZ9571072.1 EFR1 family ferrodoxin [Methanobrevibacter sp. TMH8]